MSYQNSFYSSSQFSLSRFPSRQKEPVNIRFRNTSLTSLTATEILSLPSHEFSHHAINSSIFSNSSTLMYSNPKCEHCAIKGLCRSLNEPNTKTLKCSQCVEDGQKDVYPDDPKDAAAKPRPRISLSPEGQPTANSTTTMIRPCDNSEKKRTMRLLSSDRKSIQPRPRRFASRILIPPILPELRAFIPTSG